MTTAGNSTRLPPGQFSLRAVLILVTAAAGLFAIGAALGVGSFFLVFGVLLCLANRLGMLAPVQGQRFAQAALYTASVAFAVSMFLPWREKNPAGWRYEFIVIKAAHSSLMNTMVAGIGPGGIVARAAIVSYCVLITLANGGMVLCPFLAHRLAAGKATWLRAIMALAVPGVWALPLWWSHFPADLVVGYYIWCGAITVTALVLPMRWWQLIAILFLAGWMTIVDSLYWQSLRYWV